MASRRKAVTLKNPGNDLAAPGEEGVPKDIVGDASALGDGRPPEWPIRYTGAYRELKDSDVETEPFVASLLVHGLD